MRVMIGKHAALFMCAVDAIFDLVMNSNKTCIPPYC